MSLEALEGRIYGPISVEIGAEKVAGFVNATGDDADRWAHTAPPGFAGALLFRIAPLFIHSPEVGEHTRVLVHSDQRFTWHRALNVGLATTITGEVTRVRVRGDTNFVSFEVGVTSAGEPVVDSVSTFLMGTAAAADPGPDEGEPPVEAGALTPLRSGETTLQPGVDLPTIERSASRADLVRYAGASGDFNPIHFDHDAARAAGLDGIVVHGLCMMSWLCQLAAFGTRDAHPIANMKVRFRSALRPGTPAVLSGTCADITAGLAGVNLKLSTRDADLVTATAAIRTGA